MTKVINDSSSVGSRSLRQLRGSDRRLSRSRESMKRDYHRPERYVRAVQERARRQFPDS